MQLIKIEAAQAIDLLEDHVHPVDRVRDDIVVLADERLEGLESVASQAMQRKRRADEQKWAQAGKRPQCLLSQILAALVRKPGLGHNLEIAVENAQARAVD